MLDMGFQPQVDRIVRRLPAKRQTMLFSATLDGPSASCPGYTNNPSRFEAELPSRHADGDVEHEFVASPSADKLERLIDGARQGPGARPRLRAHEARRRPARPQAARARGRGGRDARRHDPGRARAGARALPQRQGDDARRHRRRRPGPRPRRDQPRDQLRPAGRRQGLRPPRRPTGRAGRSGQGITLVLPEQQADVSRFATMLGHREQFEATGMKTHRPKLMYTSRRGRRSKW
jgi:Superfamily II DNA and RNA helicases